MASPEFLAQLQAFLKLQNPAKYDSAPPPPKKKPAPAPHDGRGGKGAWGVVPITPGGRR